jgi:MFS family permease
MDQLSVSKEKAGGLASVIMQKDMLLVLISIFLVYINLFNSLTILPLYVINIGGNDFQAGLLTTIFTLSSVVLRFILGSLADQRGRKLPLLVGSFVFATSSLLIWLAPNLFWQALARVYQAIGMATFLATGSLVVSDLTPGKFRGSVMGIYRLVTVLAFMIGPSFALSLINSHGYKMYFVFNALICFLSFVFILFLSETKKNWGQKPVSPFTNTKLLFNNISLTKAYVGIAIIASCYSVLVTYIGIFAQRYGAIDNPGLFFTLFACVGGFAGIFGGMASDRWGRSKVAWPAVSIFGLGLVVISFLPLLQGWALYLGAVLSGIGYFGTLPIFIAWVVDEAEEKIASTALAFQENVIDGSFAISSFLFVLATTYMGYPTVYLLWGLVAFISTLVIRITDKK